MARASPKVWAGVALIVLLVIADVALILRDSGPVPAPPAPAEDPPEEEDRRWRIPKAARDAVLRDLQKASSDVVFTSSPTLTVRDLAPDSPLSLAGLRPKDRIVSINGTPVQGEGAEGLLREAAGGSSLRMKILREGRTLDYRFDFE